MRWRLLCQFFIAAHVLVTFPVSAEPTFSQILLKAQRDRNFSPRHPEKLAILSQIYELLYQERERVRAGNSRERTRSFDVFSSNSFVQVLSWHQFARFRRYEILAAVRATEIDHSVLVDAYRFKKFIAEVPNHDVQNIKISEGEWQVGEYVKSTRESAMSDESKATMSQFLQKWLNDYQGEGSYLPILGSTQTIADDVQVTKWYVKASRVVQKTDLPDVQRKSAFLQYFGEGPEDIDCLDELQYAKTFIGTKQVDFGLNVGVLHSASGRIIGVSVQPEDIAVAPDPVKPF